MAASSKFTSGKNEKPNRTKGGYSKQMKILMILTYYYPYVSGLSEYARRISEALAERGHDVTILASRHDRKLPKEEIINGVKVVRCSYLIKIGKGLLMPAFVLKGYLMSKKCDAVNMHLPMPEAGILSSLIKNCIVTYHCDLKLSDSINDKAIEKLYYSSANASLRKAKKIITYTEDYAKSSKLLKNYLKKCRYAYPYINDSHFKCRNPEKFMAKHGIGKSKIIGFAGRFVYEKGLLYLLESIPSVLEKYPEAKFAFAGEYSKVAGGTVMDQISGLISKYKKSIFLLGNVDYDELPFYYSMCDVLILPSIDPLEAFGIVQAEAMLCGTPVIATSLPGVRVPIRKTGMGILIKPKSAKSIANAIISVLKNPEKFAAPRGKIVKTFNKNKAILRYEKFLSNGFKSK